jgi:putative DNA methylase
VKTPVAYLWARIVSCLNPACRAEVPLVRQWWLAKKTGKRLALKPIVDMRAKTISFEVVEVGSEETWPDEGTITRGNGVCQVCRTAIPVENVRTSAKDKSWGERLLAVVLTDPNSSGKSYRPATKEDEAVFEKAKAKLEALKEQHQGQLSLVPDEELPPKGTLGFRVNLYGIKTWGELFNARQAVSLVTFAKWVREAHKEMQERGMDEEWARGVATYLAISLDKMADLGSSVTRWKTDADCPVNAFARQALPMVWDYAEAVPISGMSGSWQSMFKRTADSLPVLVVNDYPAKVLRGTATRIPLEDNFFDAIITDPPYYDAVPYADLSDFFYVWLRRTVGHLYPEHFRTPLTPKAQEAVQNPVRHGGDNVKAKAFFEDMMAQAFKEMHRVLKPKGQATIVFAHKSTDAWETLINALIKAGFTVEASWPLHTEMATRLRARSSAALASSTVTTQPSRLGMIG